MDWYFKVIRNYIGFGGRARRKEYWMFVLVNVILTTVLSIVDSILGWQTANGKRPGLPGGALWSAGVPAVVGGAVPPSA